MATCKCGTQDKSLPGEWKSWECPQCFKERAITYTTPINPKFAEAVIHDADNRLMLLNMAVVDRKLEIALNG